MAHRVPGTSHWALKRSATPPVARLWSSNRGASTTLQQFTHTASAADLRHDTPQSLQIDRPEAGWEAYGESVVRAVSE